METRKRRAEKLAAPSPTIAELNTIIDRASGADCTFDQLIAESRATKKKAEVDLTNSQKVYEDEAAVLHQLVSAPAPVHGGLCDDLGEINYRIMRMTKLACQAADQKYKRITHLRAMIKWYDDKDKLYLRRPQASNAEKECMELLKQGTSTWTEVDEYGAKHTIKSKPGAMHSYLNRLIN